MHSGWSRRKFLGTTAGVLASAGVLRASLALRGPDQASGVVGEGDETRPDLPPLVVGLRTHGGNFRFDPVGLRVEPGTTLVWLNMGDFHTATAFHPDNDHLLPGGVPLRIPHGAEPWHSGMLGLTDGTQFEHTFAVDGVYDYFCQPHYGFGMVGRIIVGAPSGGPLPVTRPLSQLPEPAQAVMPAVEAILGPAERTLEWSARLNGVLYLIANGREAAPAARRAVEDMEGDEALRELVNTTGQERALTTVMARFLEGVEGIAGYEDLVARSDAIKTQLAAVSA